ncbi:hypothetical protein [Allopusillimonas ginsengisoli]|uniref:hypothetical protein n=1 Tax=Allopusillimonas ginsengisoli TaxID=453575 RepID=UPI001020C0D1|nr:hypothetical protein [Allopusillimonas ginsengisoli]TEA78680.1 hypothetical protein ERE07_09810 [Allopusillimonas ginsengisoli]
MTRMNLTQFAAMLGLPTSHDVESHIHAGLRSAPTTKTYKRWFDSELRRLQAGRDEAVRRFRAAVTAGEIVDADADVDLERVAQGHPDNISTQAAKRLLEKRRVAQEQS